MSKYEYEYDPSIDVASTAARVVSLVLVPGPGGQIHSV